MEKIAIIGAGISGLTVAQLLKDKYQCTVFEKESTPGGLIRCKRVNGSLYHICGGHVFNTKQQAVADWFWGFFDKDTDFIKTNRNAIVQLNNETIVPYPIENYLYHFDRQIQSKIIQDLIHLASSQTVPQNFEDFLKTKFGNTLYELYFKSYNQKIWRCNLKDIPLEWLEGKLPMPNVTEILLNNINRTEEKSFVHSTFFYEKVNGSQFIADKLSANLTIRYQQAINHIAFTGGKWVIQDESFDKVIFCGNIKELPNMISGIHIDAYIEPINRLESHGTTTVFCEIEHNPYSWVYLPDTYYQAHRIICTGNFSPTNNASGKMTGTVEFTDYMDKETILDELRKMPFTPRYLTHHYNTCTYPIQHQGTRKMIQAFKQLLKPHNFYLTGRFADWEYYNMDIAMLSAMNLVNSNFT